MSLNRRILSYLKPHTPAILLAVVAAAVYALFDAAVYVLLIPFVEAIFISGASEPAVGDNRMQSILDAAYGPGLPVRARTLRS